MFPPDLYLYFRIAVYAGVLACAMQFALKIIVALNAV